MYQSNLFKDYKICILLYMGKKNKRNNNKKKKNKKKEQKNAYGHVLLHDTQTVSIVTPTQYERLDYLDILIQCILHKIMLIF